MEICIVTKDHRRTIEGLLNLGIGPWKSYTFSPENTTNQTFRGNPSEFTLKVCFAEVGDITWELIQPLSGPTIFQEFLNRHGEGIHHVAWDCNGIPFADRLVEFKRRGCSLSQSGSWQGKNNFAFFETEGEITTCMETYEFPDNWEYPSADEVFPLKVEVLTQDIKPQGGYLPPTRGVKQLLPAGKGVAIRIGKSQSIEIINTFGGQVVDTWAFAITDPMIHMSMEHTRTSLLKAFVQRGDVLVGNNRSPMLTITSDTSSGVHDTLMAACDSHRYKEVRLPTNLIFVTLAKF